MSDVTVTLTVFAGTGGTRQLAVPSGETLALRLDKWAEGAAAVILSVPPGTVTVAPELAARLRAALDEPYGPGDADEHWQGIEDAARAVLDQLGDR